MIKYNDFFATLKDGAVIIIDTCAVLHKFSEEFFEALDSFENRHFKCLLPMDVYLETSKLAVVGKTEDIQQKALRALQLIHRGFANNTLELLKAYSNSSFFADTSIIFAVSSLSISATSVVLLSQDIRLSRAVKAVASSGAVTGGAIKVIKLASKGGGIHYFTDLEQKVNRKFQNATVQLFINKGAVERVEYWGKEA